jgi:Spy/CpxP family protein refolding chaperone
MKREHVILLIMGTITIAALAFAIGVTRSQQHAHPITLDQLHHTGKMTQLLDLSPDQVRELESLNRHLRQQLQESCHRNCSARRELISANEPDENLHESILKKMCDAYEESERATLQHIQAVRALLDEQQRRTFDQLLSRCLCGGCDSGCK